MKPVIAITMGDPAGIGPEIIVKALDSKRVRRVASPVVVGDPAVIALAAKKFGCPQPKTIIAAGVVDVKKLRPGKASLMCGKAMIECVGTAVTLVKSGRAAAMTTAPINKESARLGGFKFPGHTEFIANLAGTKDFVMMLGGSTLKVVLVTIHEPIKKVPALLTAEKILKTIRITDASFKKYFSLKRPRIAVCGLNPHAGEFGDEEMRIITPAVKKARALGIDASWPLPSDTVFYRAVRKKEFDAVVCMYHDQGLIPLKLLHFEDGVNTTLGLPIIRTSVDHGTAYDIAWKGVASEESMIAAIEAATDMAKKAAWKK